MWQTTTSRLLIATFWFGIALAAILFKTKEPYAIVVASLAMTFAGLSLIDPQSRLAGTERSAVVLMVSMLCGFMVIIGLIFAALSR